MRSRRFAFLTAVAALLWSISVFAQEPSPEAESQAGESVEKRLEQVEEQVRRLAQDQEDVQEPEEAESQELVAPDEAEEELQAIEQDEESDDDDDEATRRRRQRTDRKVSVGDRIRVRKGETVSEVVAVGTRVDVEGEVEGNVTVWAGDIVIDGYVGGDVKAFGGDIELENDADVLGHVTSFGGQIDRHRDASVLGSVSEVTVGSSLTPGFRDEPEDEIFIEDDDDLKDRFRRRRSRVVRWDELFEFAWWCVGLAVIFLLGAFTLLIAPAAMDRMSRVVRRELWKSGLVGLAVAVMSIPVFAILTVILTVTLIGIPLIPVLAFAYTLVAFLGVMTSCYALGLTISRSDLPSGRYWALGTGFILVMLPLVISEGLDFLSFLSPLGLLFWIFGWMVVFIAGVVGVGSFFLTSFGSRYPSRSSSTVPPPPPPPGAVMGEPLEGVLEEEEDWQSESYDEALEDEAYGEDGIVETDDEDEKS